MATEINNQAENAVSSFFYYMWNAWNEDECKVVYGEMSRHFWEKWSQMTGKGIFGASERFYAELTDHYWEKLVERAISLYDGKARRKLPDDSKILVCSDCGSTQIEIQAWVDVNTNEYHSDVDDDIWCLLCKDNVGTCTKHDYTEMMQEWWKHGDDAGVVEIQRYRQTRMLDRTQGVRFLIGQFWADIRRSR